ncbi:ovomucoid-like [Sminthopsis crassicaudata]|uniref:ovomucoid-like n=1 Tax=Sminthopsis crassicaudata TaxID=9301 RepID=UPI003D69CF41
MALMATDYKQGKTSDFYEFHIDKEEYTCDIFQSRRKKRFRFCSLKIHLLCATNNVTYPSLCVFCYVNIESQGSIQLKTIGKC